MSTASEGRPAEPDSLHAAVQQILRKINAAGFAVRYEGDGRAVSFVATHRLLGHFFAHTCSPGNEHEAVCILAEICGVEEFD